MIRYARLVPVESTDPLMVVSQTREPLPLELPAWTSGTTVPERLASMQKAHAGPVYPHELTPLVPSSIRATPIPHAVWDAEVPLDERRKLWQANLAADHYVPWSGGDLSPVERLEPSSVGKGLGIFGDLHNPLESMMCLMNAIDDTKLLMHYIAVVCLQFYTIKRGGFLRVRTDAQTKGFSDALPPYLMLHFRVEEARMPDHATREKAKDLPLMKTAQDAADMARAWAFPMFLLQVFRWIRDRYPVQFSEQRFKTECFCTSKIAKNTLQTMMCMRFRHVLPTGFEEALRVSHGSWEQGVSVVTTNKCFSAPKLGQMLILLPSMPGINECVPFVFCHHLFQPHKPILSQTAEEMAWSRDATTAIAMDAERKLMWKVMHFMPMQEYEVDVHKRCMQRWRTLDKSVGPLFPTDHRDKLMQYDAYLPMLRPHYMSYVLNKKNMYVYVPRMHWPTNLTPDEVHLVPMPDDADLRWMSEESFEWCVNTGRVCDTLVDAAGIGLGLGRLKRCAPGYDLANGLWGPVDAGWTPWTAWLVRQELIKPIDAPRDAFVYMKVVQLLTGREEDGIATVVRGPGRATYTELRDASDRATLAGIRDADRVLMTDKCDPDFAKALFASLTTWDRCSAMPFPSAMKRTVMRDRLWDLYFQPSRVRMDGGNASWVERFRQPSPCMAIRETMERLYRELQTEEIRAEIRTCAAMGAAAYDDLPQKYKQAWTMVQMLIEQPPSTPPPPITPKSGDKRATPALSAAASVSSSPPKRARL